jgi:hypothetical protein
MPIVGQKTESTSYTPFDGLAEWREAISQKMKLHNGISADPETEMVVSAGSCPSAFERPSKNCRKRASVSNDFHRNRSRVSRRRLPNDQRVTQTREFLDRDEANGPRDTELASAINARIQV